MVPWLWLDVFALAVASTVAVLDLDVRVGDREAGRAIYGGLVLLGLVGSYQYAVTEAQLPLPGWFVIAFAVLYLPFLHTAFIDLRTTDRFAREELHALLLNRDFRALQRGSGQDVLRVGRRRLRMHWEAHDEDDGITIELDVHPSLWPVTVSRPHVAFVRDQTHLEYLRRDIRREQAADDASV
ncbi:MAG: hypothetical protein R3B81_03160 [bacterium]